MVTIIFSWCCYNDTQETKGINEKLTYGFIYYKSYILYFI